MTNRSRAVVIAAGSNLGDRAVYLRTAIHQLRECVDLVRISSLYESEAVGWSGPDAPKYLNLVVAGITRHEPKQLLAAMLAIEAGLGRRRRRKNEPRVIDLDLIFYDALFSRERSLVIPHPRFTERNFVLLPLSELSLNWRDPRTNRAIPKYAANAGEVRKIGALFEAKWR